MTGDDEEMSSAAVFPMNMIRLCIDGYGDDLSGRAYSKLTLVPLLFSGCGELLLRMDDIFEQVGYPQAFQKRRTFFSGPTRLRETVRMSERLLDDKEMGKQQGKYQTYNIVVQSRRQSSWQGILMDPERTSMRKFQSEMDLLRCICKDLGKPFGGEEVKAFLTADFP